MPTRKSTYDTIQWLNKIKKVHGNNFKFQDLKQYGLNNHGLFMRAIHSNYIVPEKTVEIPIITDTYQSTRIIKEWRIRNKLIRGRPW